MSKNVEILAPAGNYDAFLAAISAGANAIYLAGKSYGARATAPNFSLEEIERAVKYAHINDVKIYVTINTLLSDDEVFGAMRYIKDLYNLGVDAIIVQDLGLLKMAQTAFPKMPFFASTQMTIMNSYGAKECADWGLKRVILAREVSIEDMSSIAKNSPVPIESFVHGALCVCYSGQCYFSSLVGGRSGNRGRCAQPCRMQYGLYCNNQILDMESHLLSPKDLFGLPHVDKIIEAGVGSLKIEGRMKRPEYVATVVKAYAGGISDDEAETKRQVEQAFNREFTSGYLVDNPGFNMISYKRPNNRGLMVGRIEEIHSDNLAIISLVGTINIGDGLEIWVTKGGRQGFTINHIECGGKAIETAMLPMKVMINYAGKAQKGDRVFKTSDVILNNEACAMMVENTKPVTMCITAKVGEKVALKVSDDNGNIIEVIDEFIVPIAQKHASNYESIHKQLSRLGGSFWHLANLELDIDDNIMLPASVLNQIRRDAMQKLEEKRLSTFRHDKIDNLTIRASNKKKQATHARLAVFVSDFESAINAQENGAHILYVGGEVFRGYRAFKPEQIDELSKKSDVYYVLPAICSEKELDKHKTFIKKLLKTNVTGVAVGNLWGLNLLKEVKWDKDIVGDFSLNVFNSQTGDALTKAGLSRIALSYEMNFEQIENLGGTFKRECLVGGNLQMMVSEHCAIGAIVDEDYETTCTKACKKGNYYIKDQKDFKFPVICDNNCRMHIYNGYQLCLLEDLPRFMACGVDVIRLDLRHYNHVSVGRTVNGYARVLNELNKGYLPDYIGPKEKIAASAMGPLTKGHYYRGVFEK